MPLLLICVIAWLSVACTSHPILASNEKLLRVGDAGARDRAACEKLADEHGRRQRTPSTARVVDVAVGALGPVDVGDVGEDAHRKITEYCLRKRGYGVTGWD